MEQETVNLTEITNLIIDQNEQLEYISTMVAEQNETVAGIYTGFLFYIGIATAVLVCVLLYKFLRLFF